jgi:hypothetical protein
MANQFTLKTPPEQWLKTLEEAERQKSWIRKSPLRAPGRKQPTTFTAPQAYVDPPSLRWRGSPGQQGPSVRPLTTAQQAYVDLLPLLWKSGRAIAAQPVLPAVGTSSQAYVDSPSIVTKASPGQQGPSVWQLFASQQAYSDGPGIWQRSLFQAPGPSLYQFVTGPAPFDYYASSYAWPSLVGTVATYAVPALVTAQQGYVDPPSLVVGASPGYAGPTVRALLAGPPAFDYTSPALVVGSLPTPPPTISVAPISVWAPQGIDLTQQALFSFPSVTPPAQVPQFHQIFVASPQQVDLTQQGPLMPSAFFGGRPFIMIINE